LAAIQKHQKYLLYSLLIILIWIPIPLGSNRPWAWSIMQIMIFGLFICCVWSNRKISWLGLREFRIPIYLWLAFLLLALIQTIPMGSELVRLLSPMAFELQKSGGSETFYLSTDHGQSQISLVKSLSYFSLFIIVLMLIKTTDAINKLLITILISASLQALYGTFEVLFGLQHSMIFKLPVSDTVTGSFVYRNHFANFIMMGLAAGIGIMVASLQATKTRGSRDLVRSIVSTLLSNKALIRICLAIMVIALVMSKSRMGNVSFFLSMTVCGVIALGLIKNRNKGLTILIVSMFVVDVFIVSAWFGLDKVQERLTQTSLTQESRDEVVLDSIPIVGDFPVLGSGGGTFYSIFPQYKTAEIHSFYDHAHNDYLQMTIEYGIPAFCLMVILVGFSLYKALHAMRYRRMSIMKGAAFSSSMAIIGMLIHMTVDFPIQAPANAGYFIVFLGLAWVINVIKIKIPRTKNSSSLDGMKREQ
jgi:putative inorganic carbon (HCO3(-)) transporter